MIPHKNTVPHNPPHTWGDCHRCCIATILGLAPEDVPHFFEHGHSNHYIEDLKAFLDEYDLTRVFTVYDGDKTSVELTQIIGANNPGVAFILGGMSARGCGHSIVIMDGQVINDPTGSGIVGPMEDGYYHVETFGLKPNYFKLIETLDLDALTPDDKAVLRDVLHVPGPIQNLHWGDRIPDPVMEDTKALMQEVGDAIANVIEQMLNGGWVDDQGHPVTKNVKMTELGQALHNMTTFRHKHLGYTLSEHHRGTNQ